MKRIASGYKRRGTKGAGELDAMVQNAGPAEQAAPTPMPDKSELDRMYKSLLEELAIPEGKREAMINKEPDDRKWKLIQHHSAMVKLAKTDPKQSKTSTPGYWVEVIQGRNGASEPSMTIAMASELQVVIRTSHKQFLKEFIDMHGVHMLVDLTRWYTGRSPRSAEEKEILPQIMTCFKALMNNQMGMDAVLGIEDSVTAIAMTMDLNDVTDIRTAQEVVMLLAVTCFYSSLGRNLVVKAMDDMRIRYREGARFESLVTLFEECNDNEFRAAVIMFITTIVNSAATVDSRVRVRNDFLALDIMRVFEQAVSLATDEDQACTVIATQFQVFEDMMVADHSEVIHSLFDMKDDDASSQASYDDDSEALDLSDQGQVIEVVRANSLRAGTPEVLLELFQALLLVPAERTLAVPTLTAITQFVREATDFDMGNHRARTVKLNYGLLHELLDKRLELDNNLAQLSSSDEIINKQSIRIQVLEGRVEKGPKVRKGDKGIKEIKGDKEGDEFEIMQQTITKQQESIDYWKKKAHRLKKEMKRNSKTGSIISAVAPTANGTPGDSNAANNESFIDNDAEVDSTGLSPAGRAPGKRAAMPPCPSPGMPGSLDQAPVKITPALQAKVKAIYKAAGKAGKGGKTMSKTATAAPAAGGMGALMGMLANRAATSEAPAKPAGPTGAEKAAKAVMDKKQAALSKKFPEKKAIYPNIKMRSVFWTKIQTNQLEGTIWEGMTDNKAKIEPKQLEAQFGKEAVAVKRVNTLDRKAKSEVHLCDNKRQQNIGIAISRFRTTDAELRAAIMRMEETLLTLERATALTVLAPTPEERELISNFEETNGKIKKLCREDQFLVEMATIPRMALRMKCIVTKLTFEQDTELLQDRLIQIRSACMEVERSKPLRQLLEIVLAVGNYTNGGTPRGQAYGFKLDALSKLEMVKGNGGKHTLMHFLVQLLELHYPQLLRFSLPEATAACDMSLAELQKELNTAHASLREVKGELEEDHSDKADRFVKVMGPFHVRASKRIDDLSSDFERVRQEFQRIAMLFSEKGAKVEPATVFDKLVKFLQSLGRCKEQIDQQRMRAARQRKLEEEKQRRKLSRKQGSEGGKSGSGGPGVFEQFANANAGNASDIVENFLQRYRKSSYANLRQEQGGGRDSGASGGGGGGGGDEGGGGGNELQAILQRRKKKDVSKKKKKKGSKGGKPKNADFAIA